MVAVFTKYDQFKCDVKIELVSNSQNASSEDVMNEAEKNFHEHYLGVLKSNPPRNVRLESKFWYDLFHYMVVVSYLIGMHKKNASCHELLEETACALNDEVVTLMLLAVQRKNLEMSVKMAVWMQASAKS